jgi:hypothetical protein
VPQDALDSGRVRAAFWFTEEFGNRIGRLVP